MARFGVRGSPCVDSGSTDMSYLISGTFSASVAGSIRSSGAEEPIWGEVCDWCPLRVYSLSPSAIGEPLQVYSLSLSAVCEPPIQFSAVCAEGTPTAGFGPRLPRLGSLASSLPRKTPPLWFRLLRLLVPATGVFSLPFCDWCPLERRHHSALALLSQPLALLVLTAVVVQRRHVNLDKVGGGSSGRLADLGAPLFPRPEHRSHHTCEGDGAPQAVASVGADAVDPPAPEVREEDEKAPVHRVHPSEGVTRLRARVRKGSGGGQEGVMRGGLAAGGPESLFELVGWFDWPFSPRKSGYDSGAQGRYIRLTAQ
eukprot:1187495-Prorocentrum_minimum.AAC.1